MHILCPLIGPFLVSAVVFGVDQLRALRLSVVKTLKHSGEKDCAMIFKLISFARVKD